MKKPFNLLTGVLLLVFAYNTVNAQVKSAYNKTIDFNKYRTYSFGGWEKYSGHELNDLDKSLFLSAFKEEFTVRNMAVVTDNADLVFTLIFGVDITFTNYVDDDLNKPQNLYQDKSDGKLYNSLFRQSNEVGKVIVNFFDGETKEKIGEATLVKPLSKNEKKHEKNISKAVKTLMKKYPVVTQKI